MLWDSICLRNNLVKIECEHKIYYGLSIYSNKTLHHFIINLVDVSITLAECTFDCHVVHKPAKWKCRKDIQEETHS